MADLSAILQELYRRIDTLPPDKAAIVLEVAKRFNIGKAAAQSRTSVLNRIGAQMDQHYVIPPQMDPALRDHTMDGVDFSRPGFDAKMQAAHQLLSNLTSESLKTPMFYAAAPEAEAPAASAGAAAFFGRLAKLGTVAGAQPLVYHGARLAHVPEGTANVLGDAASLGTGRMLFHGPSLSDADLADAVNRGLDLRSDLTDDEIRALRNSLPPSGSTPTTPPSTPRPPSPVRPVIRNFAIRQTVGRVPGIGPTLADKMTGGPRSGTLVDSFRQLFFPPELAGEETPKFQPAPQLYPRPSMTSRFNPETPQKTPVAPPPIYYKPQPEPVPTVAPPPIYWRPPAPEPVTPSPAPDARSLYYPDRFAEPPAPAPSPPAPYQPAPDAQSLFYPKRQWSASDPQATQGSPTPSPEPTLPPPNPVTPQPQPVASAPVPPPTPETGTPAPGQNLLDPNHETVRRVQRGVPNKANAIMDWMDRNPTIVPKGSPATDEILNRINSDEVLQHGKNIGLLPQKQKSFGSMLKRDGIPNPNWDGKHPDDRWIQTPSSVYQTLVKEGYITPQNPSASVPPPIAPPTPQPVPPPDLTSQLQGSLNQVGQKFAPEVEKAYLKLANGNYNTRILLKDLRPELLKMGLNPTQQDAAFEQLMRNQQANLFNENDPMAVTPEDEAAAYHIPLVAPRHLISLTRPK